jgi:hypothetical protein
MAETKTTESAASRANRTEPFNWDTFAVEDAAPPSRASSRSPESNPALPHVRNSWDKRDADTGLGSGKRITVPQAKAQEFVNYVRYATNYLTEQLGEQIGSSIKVGDPDKNGNVTIHFAAKRRRKNNRTNGQPA